MAVRTYGDECGYLEQVTESSIRIKKGFVPNMNVSLVLSSVFFVSVFFFGSD